jgi:exopolysaccharide biosynthesis WecB/TagA/CpsF family protein
MRQPDTIALFGLDLVNAETSAALDAMLSGAAVTAAFVNAHCVNVAAKDVAYRWALSAADYLLPDGSGLQLAAKLKGRRFVENLNGTDLFPSLCKTAAERGLSIYLFGSAEGVAARAAEAAQDLAPGLRIAGCRHGFFEESEEGEIIERINASGADIVLVALGVPKQDLWIARNRYRINARLVMGVGAQFDFWSGRVPRAPEYMRRHGMEWIMRLAVEPKRLAHRYLVGNFEFVLRALAPQDLSFGRAAGIVGKRAMDFTLSSLALILLGPLMALIALAIRIDSPGPALFRQKRVGKDGEIFVCYKFRSMRVDAEARRAELLAASDRKGVCFKSKNDPRITRLGRWLRRFSLDELPQILNIWKGDMAIVGPRPALPSEVAAYPARALQRLDVKPGLTGVWQVSGRADIDFDRMVDIDASYAKCRTIWLDFVMIALTVRAVVGGRGAY